MSYDVLSLQLFVLPSVVVVVVAISPVKTPTTVCYFVFFTALKHNKLKFIKQKLINYYSTVRHIGKSAGPICHLFDSNMKVFQTVIILLNSCHSKT